MQPLVAKNLLVVEDACLLALDPEEVLRADGAVGSLACLTPREGHAPVVLAAGQEARIGPGRWPSLRWITEPCTTRKPVALLQGAFRPDRTARLQPKDRSRRSSFVDPGLGLARLRKRLPDPACNRCPAGYRQRRPSPLDWAVR